MCNCDVICHAVVFTMGTENIGMFAAAAGAATAAASVAVAPAQDLVWLSPHGRLSWALLWPQHR